MRIVFIGAVEFSLRALEHSLDINADIAEVCTLKESKFNCDHIDLASLSEERGLPWYYVAYFDSLDCRDWIQQKSPDVIFCFGWSKLLMYYLLSLAPLGVVGFHPVALPANRGLHPLV